MARVRFLKEGIEIEVEDGSTILEAAKRAGAPEGDRCGGVCACSTCHVIVRQGHDTLSKATDDEEDMLDSAPGLTPTSRLACQAVPNGTKDVVVEIPRWNRNHAKEDH